MSATPGTGARPKLKLPPMFFITSALSTLLVAVGIAGLARADLLPSGWTFQHSVTALGAGLGLELWAVILLLQALRAARRGGEPT